MLPCCSSEITILRKQNRKGSDVTRRNRITWKQKPSRLALFQKLELQKLWRRACFLWIPWEIIFLSHLEPSPCAFIELQNFFQITFDVIANTKGWRKKTGRWNCVWFPVGAERNWGQSRVKHQYFSLYESFPLQGNPETAPKLWIVDSITWNVVV